MSITTPAWSARTIAGAERWFVALDIDGTLLHEDGSHSDDVARAVRRAVDAGHHVLLATGRSQATTESVVETFGIAPDYLVCSNGAMVLERRDDAYELMHVETFDAEQVLRTVSTTLPEGRFMVEDERGNRLYTRGMTSWALDGATEVAFEQLWAQPVTRVVVVSPDHETDEFLEIVESMGLHKVSYSIGYSSWLDIAPDGVDKSTGLELLVTSLGVPRDRILVMGDGRNDIEMLEWAAAGGGRAVAMGQAPDEVVEAASETTGTVDVDGAAAVLDSLP